MVRKPIVPLERFWLPVGKSYSLTSAGWLSDPDSSAPWRPNADAISTGKLADRRCLVLLGEPGTGKTSAIAFGREVRPGVDPLEEFHVPLGVFASEERLNHAVFQSERIAKWQSGTGFLCLTLDGFDEALNRVETLDRLLAWHLAEWDCERLFIRLVCRTADWPHTLQEVLEDRFDEANVHELLPLRRTDAERVLQSAGIDAAPVLRAVEKARIVPLAARPLTLNLIRSSIHPDGSLPQSARDLYDRGITALLDEMNPERRQAVQGPGAVARRMKTAQRIAAISLFGDRPTVWTGPVAEALEDDLTVDDCLSQHRAHDLAVASADVQATLRSGVFTGAGESRLTWAHATFADFLTAKWLLDEKLEDEQVMSLLLANDGRIYARVRQVAAWLVGLAPSRFRGLIEVDPQAFLASVDVPDENLREEIVAALLREARAGHAFDDFETDFSGLEHSMLATQLRLPLQSGSESERRLAIRISRACSSRASVPDLVDLALNDSADLSLRSAAAMAVYDLAAEAPSHALLPLIGPLSTHNDKELEAAALLASWPHAISTETVFTVLSPTKPNNYHGLYSIFIDTLAHRLQREDLRSACAWILADPSRLDDSRLTTLTTEILRLCLANLDDDEARNFVTRVALSRLKQYRPPFGDADYPGEAIELGANERRTVTELLLGQATENEVWGIAQQTSSQGSRLLWDEDLFWLLQLYAESDGLPRERAGLAAQLLYDPGLVDHNDIVLGLADDHPAAHLFLQWRSTVKLDSAEAIAAREHWRKLTRQREERVRKSESEAGDEWVNPRIETDIAEAASGDASKFWYAARLVTVGPHTTRFMDQQQPDLTLHPRWNTLSERARKDFVVAAQRYVEEGECQPERWLAQDKTSYVAQAGYRALILLLRLLPTGVSEVSPSAWRAWAPILISWTVMVDGADETDKRRLLSTALPHAEDELREVILTLVDKAITDQSHLFLRAELETLASHRLAAELVDRLAQPMAAETRRSILDFLLAYDARLVVPVLHSWLDRPARKQDPKRAMDAADRLLRHDATHSWPVLRALMDEDPTFMKSALLEGAQAFDRRAPNLSPLDLADLYLWLCKHFPHAEDPKFDDGHFVEPRESVGVWRDSLLSALSGMGTIEGVAAVERIMLAKPGDVWIERVLQSAKYALRERSWEPLRVVDIDQLAESQHKRIVRSNADLLVAALAALDDIQDRLQADTPSSYLLWDTHAQRPKSEEEISDYLAIELTRRLRDSGVIVNREVQVRRSKPSGLAERTDLRIEALAPEGAEVPRGSLRIPGEVKGAWNAGLLDDMHTQLADRYMVDFQTQHGVYVVAWFDQGSWTSSDTRRARAASWGGIEDLRAQLAIEGERERQQGRRVAVRVLDCSLKRPTRLGDA